jgi:hypothetical protein
MKHASDSSVYKFQELQNSDRLQQIEQYEKAVRNQIEVN